MRRCSLSRKPAGPAKPTALKLLLDAKRPLPRAELGTQPPPSTDVSSSVIRNPNGEDAVYFDSRWHLFLFGGAGAITTTTTTATATSSSSSSSILGKRDGGSDGAGGSSTQLQQQLNAKRSRMGGVPASFKVKPQAASLKRKAKEQLVNQILQKSAELQALRSKNGTSAAAAAQPTNTATTSSSSSTQQRAGRSSDVNNSQLHELCGKWRGACQEVLRALLQEVSRTGAKRDSEQVTMKAMLKFYNVDPQLVGYDDDLEDFVDAEEKAEEENENDNSFFCDIAY